MVKDVVGRIGKKIKDLRKENGLSTKELSKKSGISTAGINKIERGQIFPTITTLMKIANALDRKVSFFIEEESWDDRGFIRNGERKQFHNPSSKIIFENIAARLRNCSIDAGFSIIEPGGSSGPGYMTHLGEELIYCVKGKIDYFLEEQKYILRPGDCLHFKSSIPHRWKNNTKSASKILGVITPPPFIK